jgi:hypothetical protein
VRNSRGKNCRLTLLLSAGAVLVLAGQQLQRVRANVVFWGPSHFDRSNPPTFEASLNRAGRKPVNVTDNPLYDLQVRIIGVPAPELICVSLWLLGGLLSGVYLYLMVNDRAPVRTCFRCGYDLRATPDRCPECGTERRVAQRL